MVVDRSEFSAPAATSFYLYLASLVHLACDSLSGNSLTHYPRASTDSVSPEVFACAYFDIVNAASCAVALTYMHSLSCHMVILEENLKVGIHHTAE